MAFPATVTGNWSDHKPARHGLTVVGSALYCFTIDRGAGKVRAFKSTDGGNTWAEQDSGNAPATGTTAAYRSCDVAPLVGSTFHVLCYADIGGTLSVHQFSTASDTWGAATGSTDAPVVVDMSTAGNGGTSLGQMRAALTVLSDGSYIVFYQGARKTVLGSDFARFYSKKYSAGAWQDTAHTHEWGQGLTQARCLFAAILGDSDRSHTFYAQNTGRHTQSIDSGNFLEGTRVQITVVGSSSDHAGFSAPFSWLNAGATEVLYVFFSSATGTSVGWFTSADAPTLSSGLVNNTSHGSIEEGLGQVCKEATTSVLHAAVLLGNQAGHALGAVWKTDDAGTHTWATATIQEDYATNAAITCWVPCTSLPGQGVGYLVERNSDGAVLYDGPVCTFGVPCRCRGRDRAGRCTRPCSR